MQEDREFQQREANYATTMGDLIASFGKNVVEAHNQNQMQYVEYVRQLAQIENIRWACEVGILTLDQALTMMANIPIFAVADTDPFVFTEADLQMEMKVSAHREDSSKLGVKTGTEVNAKIGGLVGLFGGGGSVKVTADTTYQKDHRRTSDYSSTVKASVKMARVPAPEGVQLIRDTTNEVVSKAMEINKDIIQLQMDRLKAEQEQAEVPASLPDGILEGGNDGGTTAAPASE